MSIKLKRKRGRPLGRPHVLKFVVVVSVAVAVFGFVLVVAVLIVFLIVLIVIITWHIFFLHWGFICYRNIVSPKRRIYSALFIF